jgi:hypothetical protein
MVTALIDSDLDRSSSGTVSRRWSSSVDLPAIRLQESKVAESEFFRVQGVDPERPWFLRSSAGKTVASEVSDRPAPNLWKGPAVLGSSGTPPAGLTQPHDKFADELVLESFARLPERAPSASSTQKTRSSSAGASQQEARAIILDHFFNPILSDLEGLERRAMQPTAAVNADGLLRNIRALTDSLPNDPISIFFSAFHDALAHSGRWAAYSAEQYQGASEVLRKLSKRTSLSSDAAIRASLELEALGFETLPFGGPEEDVAAAG